MSEMNNEDILGNIKSQAHAEKVKNSIRIATISVVVLIVTVLVIGYNLGWFDSAEPLKNFALNMGWPGFALLSLLVVLNNVVSVIPGNLPGLAMFMAYGPLWGFAFATIFIIVGSIISFGLSRKFGPIFVQAFIPQSIYDKYIDKIVDEKTATKIALIGYWVPGIYDGAVTMISGLTNISWVRYLTILVLSKPVPTFIYFAGATGATYFATDWLFNIF